MVSLGQWASDNAELERLANEFQSNAPFPHVTIPNFFNVESAGTIAQDFPCPLDEGSREGWFMYNNPIEKKFACNSLQSMPESLQGALRLLQDEEAVRLMSVISGIEGLESDPHLHGGGLHYHPNGGKLDMHLDYSLHPLSGKERRLNLIVYMTPDWQEEWGGGLQLWEAGMSRLGKTLPCMFNTGVLFRTSDESWHGLPDPIVCPDGKARQSVAVYFLSEPRTDATLRQKAQFVGRPTDVPNQGLDKLRELRVQRRLSKEDVAQHMPGWDEYMRFPGWPVQ